jgi:hypothetical protein
LTHHIGVVFTVIVSQGVYTMNHMLKNTLCLALLGGTMACAKVIPYISIRSQAENAARELVLWQKQINLYDMDKCYSSFSITPEYTRTFRPTKMAKCLFSDALIGSCGDEQCSSFLVQGSTYGLNNPPTNLNARRSDKALLADYFGLPTDYASIVTIQPKIENFLVDFNFYWGLDRWAEGLYFRAHFPVVHTRWSLGFDEEVVQAGTTNYPIGYFNDAILGTDPAFYGVARSSLLNNFGEYAAAGLVPNLGETVTFKPLEKAKFYGCAKDLTAVADLQMALGWNFWMCNDYHVGLNIRGAAPTGNRPQGRYLFEPIVGNGKHWELGVGLTSHWMAWQSDDECDDFSIYLDANITHMFKAHQCRTLDLCGKPLSRYMLAAKMDAKTANLTDVTHTAPTYQFANVLTPVANLSTIAVDVSAAIQADVVLKLAYTHKNFQFDLGYEFWTRTCEKIHPRCDCCSSDTQAWALKGDAFVYGFGLNAISAPTVIEPLALSSSEADATIFCGTGNAQRSGTPLFIQNPGVDNPKAAYQTIVSPGWPNVVNFNPNAVAEEDIWKPMYSSFNPNVFLTSETKQWDLRGSKGISNKIFGNFGYTWTEHCPWVPYFGVGAEVEFGQHKCECGCTPASTICQTNNPAPIVLQARSRGDDCCNSCNTNNNCNNNCNSCDDENRDDCCSCAISQWGIWVKGGVSFN